MKVGREILLDSLSLFDRRLFLINTSIINTHTYMEHRYGTVRKSQFILKGGNSHPFPFVLFCLMILWELRCD